MSQVKSDYLYSVYNVSEFANLAKKTVHAAQRMMKQIPFDAIAFTGTSGAAMAYILSAEMGIPLICVRKETDNSHYVKGHGHLEGFVQAKRFAFVDDFISSGSTFRRVKEVITSKMPKAECVGIILYAATRQDYERTFDNKNMHVFTTYDGTDGYEDESWRQQRIQFTTKDGMPIRY
jgi:adenine/guanine phosphoribosyltransferase-like PRPP-binding protein